MSTRKIIIENNCKQKRTIKFDGNTTPLYIGNQLGIRPIPNTSGCTLGSALPPNDPKNITGGTLYCKKNKDGETNFYTNPVFDLEPGTRKEIEVNDDGWSSATGWIAKDCNIYGEECKLGDSANKNALFEWTIPAKNQGNIFYDLSAVNGYTNISSVGIEAKSSVPPPRNMDGNFWQKYTSCSYDIAKYCPDGTNRFLPNDSKNNFMSSEPKDLQTPITFNKDCVGGCQWTYGDNDFDRSILNKQLAFPSDIIEDKNSNRRYNCFFEKNAVKCTHSGEYNTCLGPCDLCLVENNNNPEKCKQYCCPFDGYCKPLDVTQNPVNSTNLPDCDPNIGNCTTDFTVFNPTNKYYYLDSAGCRALKVQSGTNYTRNLVGKGGNDCKNVYTYGYDDFNSTFQADNGAQMTVSVCGRQTKRKCCNKKK